MDNQKKNNNDQNNTKTFLGAPMRWESDKMFKNLWNKEDERVFPPKYFGIGWDLNLHALCKKIGLVKKGE
jgi:uncharacterized membrane protein